MSGRPAVQPGVGTCTGDWACDGTSHCTCWWASTPERSNPCCQCADDPGYLPDAERCPAGGAHTFGEREAWDHTTHTACLECGAAPERNTR